MVKNILITGGAGFIGSHLADNLLSHGYSVRCYDALLPQVHGADARRPEYLSPDVELIIGDIRDRAKLAESLRGIDAVFHLSATVGVGQSMYQMVNYSDVNCVGTATLLEALAERPVEKLVVASSMSIYGEGLYQAASGGFVEGVERSLAQLKRRDWQVRGPDGEVLRPVPTRESKLPGTPSVYALSKYYQEKICLRTCAAYGIAATALRFFNVFGARQALSNPYTGVIAIFASRILNGRPPLVHEDGRQLRDFIYVKDVVNGCRLAMESAEAAGQVFNIGSGQRYAIGDLAVELAEALGRGEIEPEMTGKYRVGDIRNCFADIGKARATLRFEPAYSFQKGLREMASWLEEQTAEDYVPTAAHELSVRGLTV